MKTITLLHILSISLVILLKRIRAHHYSVVNARPINRQYPHSPYARIFEDTGSTLSKLRNQAKHFHCLCATPQAERDARIQCMEYFVPALATWTMSQGIQKCGNFAWQKGWGSTAHKVDYNPWEYHADEILEMYCKKYSNIRPGVYSKANIESAGLHGMMLSKCALRHAELYGEATTKMLEYCCGEPIAPSPVPTNPQQPKPTYPPAPEPQWRKMY